MITQPTHELYNKVYGAITEKTDVNMPILLGSVAIWELEELNDLIHNMINEKFNLKNNMTYKESIEIEKRNILVYLQKYGSNYSGLIFNNYGGFGFEQDFKTALTELSQEKKVKLNPNPHPLGYYCEPLKQTNNTEKT